MHYEDDFDDEPPEPEFPPEEPTGYGPGSSDKIDVMRQRFERGLELYHPLDAGTCQTLPESVGGKTYVTGDISGLSLRSHRGSQDWFVSIHVAYVERSKRLWIDGCREVITWFKYHVGPKKCIRLVSGRPIQIASPQFDDLPSHYCD